MSDVGPGENSARGFARTAKNPHLCTLQNPDRMLHTEDTRIEALAIHVVGNRAKDEPLLASPGLSPQTDDEALMHTLTAYFLDGFKSEMSYNLYHESDPGCNEVWNFAGKVFDNPATLYEQSVNLARHLYACGTLPQIKGGEFYVVYFSGCRFGGERVDALGLFKSETRDTFLDTEAQDDGVHLATRQGIDIKRLDKGAVIFNLERNEGFVVQIVDNTNRSEARYWIDDFLHVRERQDSYHNTHNAMVMCKRYVTKHLAQEFDVSKADQAELLNDTMSYFREQDSFSMEEFSEKVIRQPEVAESFARFRQQYEEERDIRIEDCFDISDAAVKRQARTYKSVIKLDRNFHIYVHGNRNLLEQGEDEKGKYYKVYYEQEE